MVEFSVAAEPPQSTPADARGKEAPMGKVKGLGGVFFYANEPHKLSEWYTTHLGINLAYNEACNNYYTTFRYRECDHGQEEANIVFAILPAKTPLAVPRETFMLNFCVDDLNAILEALQQQGVHVEKREDYSYGRFAWIRDPENNLVELYQPLEGS